MKNIVIYIFLFLFNFLGYNQTRFRSRSLPAPNFEKTWEIVEISKNKITTFLDGLDTITETLIKPHEVSNCYSFNIIDKDTFVSGKG